MPLHDSLRMIVLRCSVVLAPIALFACGPSIKAAVESDMRFEHCYRIDDDPSTPVASKRSCWSEWSSRYTKGQARERLHYAKARITVLDGALATAPTVGPAGPLATTAGTPVACPPPATPYAPPPAVVPKTADAVNSSASICAETCTTTWRACANPCGATAACVLACDDKFRLCVKACL